jgi:gliding motility-associated transport system permease protein
VRILLTLLGKEAGALFSSSIAYAVISVFLLLMGYAFTAFLFLNRAATLVHIFFQAAVLFLLIVPLLTMRQFAEERKTGTLELLLTAPVRELQIVLAKFLACMAVNAVMLVLSLTYAVVLQAYGEPDWGPIYSGYLGLVLFTASLVALGLPVSALTANQIVAAMVTLGMFLGLWMVDALGSLLPYPFDNMVMSVSLLAHFTPFATGAMYVSDVGFFVSLILLGLFLGVRALVRR